MKRFVTTVLLLAMCNQCLLREKSRDALDMTTLLSFLVGSSRTIRFLYVVSNAASSSVSVYSVNPSNGSLTTLPSVSTGNGGQGIVLDPTGRYAYVTGSTANGVTQFNVNSGTGALTAMSPALVGGIASPYALAMEPSGKALIVPAGTGSTIYPFAISSNGALSSLTTATGGSFMQGAAVDPAGKFAFFPAATGNAIFGFSINSDGSLAATAQVSLGQAGATHVAIHPNGRFLYSLSNASGTLFIYSIDQTTGALSAITNIPGLTDNTAITITPAGDFLYVSQASPQNKISMYSINSSNGTLTALSPASVTTGHPLASGGIDPSGRLFYIANYSANTVSIFSIGSSGVLTPSSPATVSTGSSPFGVGILSY